MSTPLEHGIADIVRWGLIAATQGTDPALGHPWPVFAGHMPDGPDNAVCVYEVQGVKDGRVMKTGETIRHPGWQVRVRAVGYPEAYAKANDISRTLDGWLRFIVAIDAKSYTIGSVTQTGDVLSLGQEPDAKRRQILTLNGTITLA